MSENEGSGHGSSGRERAVALQYSEHDAVPRIVSSGAGEVARAIVALAQSSGVPVREDPRLVELLAQIPVGASISPESYRLVAELISFLYFADHGFREKHPELGPIVGVKSAPEATDSPALLSSPRSADR